MVQCAAANEGGWIVNPIHQVTDESAAAVRSSRGQKPQTSAVWHAKTPRHVQTHVQVAKESPRVSVVIPTLNEAKNLEHVLPELPDGLFEVIVVDGGSTDGTVQTARRLRPDAHVVSQTRCGKGNALACGFAACSGDIIVMLDADGSADPGEIARFVDTLVAGADFAKGSRFLGDGGSEDITWVRSWGNRCLGLLVNTLFHSRYSDLCYGYNAFWAETCLPFFELEWESPPPEDGDGRLWGDGFEIETLINIRVAASDLRVREVPSFERSRMHGTSNLHAFADGRRVLHTILKERRRTRRAAGARGNAPIGRVDRPLARMGQTGAPARAHTLDSSI
jgi:glycosyltransferase involved in cell wall biosynthesis